MKKAFIPMLCALPLFSIISDLAEAFVENTLAKDIITYSCSILALALDIWLCVILLKSTFGDKQKAEGTDVARSKLYWILGVVAFALEVVAAEIVTWCV